MIQRLLIENFRCLRKVDIALEPLTVFVGANASGKSSVFAALESARISAAETWRGQGGPTTITAICDGRTVARTRTERDFGGPGGFPDCLSVQLDLKEIRSPVQVHESQRMQPSGFGLANVFATLPRRTQDDVARHFVRLVPMFGDVGARPLAQGNHRLVFQDRWQSDLWYEPTQVSDGSMFTLALLLLAYQSPPPDLVAIEEPERGLHPYLLGQMIDTLRKLATGQIGPKPVQILVATHSAELLEFVAPREVRFFRRDKEAGETIVEQAPTDDENWLQTLREYDDSLGDLWLSGGLGGVPGR